MRYVILRDDDTNAFTPVACLERLYRPFLERGLPVNLATIPNVSTGTTGPDGCREKFLGVPSGPEEKNRTIGQNAALVDYLIANPGYHIVQHGYDHACFEFESNDLADISRRLDEGTKLLLAAGFKKPRAFVAPYDRFTSRSLKETARRFDTISTGWFELGRLPRSWWPQYALKKALQRPHFRAGATRLLSHPGCLLSYHHPYESMLDQIKRTLADRQLTVLVTHWWEYFREQKPDDPFISVLHETAAWLAGQKDIQVISFDDLADGRAQIR